ncbi:zinc transporter ZIP10 isoform X1 [Aplysia californica]|uniref:Zinc transporter ZIP10 isoform X1 n=1 Tax=Aplysia californica TaxID=6500 RepID=A0ABM1ADN4_APLCA|nr:zinc transporter ZIP10 isoform X2 [Aplysia californica]XP_035829278.1 zinc transporter ZIP10 isoform X1 [Aplysia californica]
MSPSLSLTTLTVHTMTLLVVGLCPGSCFLHDGLTLTHSDDFSGIDNLTEWHVHIHMDNNVSEMFNVSVAAVTLQESYFFISQLFQKYGRPNSLEQASLAALMDHLGIGSGAGHSHDAGTTSDHKHDPSADHQHDHGSDHQHDPSADHQHDPSADHQHDHGSDHQHDHGQGDDSATSEDKERFPRSVPTHHVHNTHQECLSLSDMLHAFHLAPKSGLTTVQFAYLCPALIYQLDSDVCQHHRHHTGDPHDHGTDDHHAEGEAAVSPTFDLAAIPAKVWGFSCVAVLIISLVGLLGVAVIPIMQKVFYNHMLQFLVALAVGALAGDALLHLLPHSIMASSGHSHSHGDKGGGDDHSTAAWKGLSALGGILFFFITERLLTIYTIIKRNRKSNKQQRKKRCEQYCDIESDKKAVGSKMSHRQNSDEGCDRTVMMVHPNKDVDESSFQALKSYADAAHEEFLHQCDDTDDATSPMTDVSVTDALRARAGDHGADTELMELSLAAGENGHSHTHGHHSPALGHGGHSHGGHGGHGGHGHSHSVPNSVAAVAWMVILGDGIHNFSDGLAIGAAFASSITGGFSTSVAVFCHELPHEIGDFAVLLRAGMSAKQAILYNCLSSLLCFLGMLIGVAIGNISSASLWIFAVVGGMFLYIALVDMLPEMSSMDTQKGENPFLHLLFQVLGIVLGSGIMLLIALYEHDIKTALD